MYGKFKFSDLGKRFSRKVDAEVGLTSQAATSTQVRPNSPSVLQIFAALMINSFNPPFSDFKYKYSTVNAIFKCQ